MMQTCELPGRNRQIRTGTYAGYRAHQKALETPCSACGEAATAYKASYYTKHKPRLNEASRLGYQAHKSERQELGRKYYLQNKPHLRAANEEWKRAHPERVKELAIRKERRRNEQMRSTAVEPIDRWEIFERDNWICGWCRKNVDASLHYQHPLAATMDHVVPLSRGGRHVRENVQLTHRKCNDEKGARLWAS